MEAVASEQNKYFKLEVFYDESTESPREYDNLGTFITRDRGYNSPDDNPFNEPEEFLREWLPTTLNKCPACGNDGVTSMDDEVGTISPIIVTDNDHAIIECSWCGEEWTPGPGRGADGVLLPVFKYEHSGIAYSTGAFSDPWDSGQVGFIYATAEDIAENFGEPNGSAWMAKYHAGKTIQEVVAECLKSEVDTYSSWANGERYGYVLSEWKGCYDGEDRYEEIDSCWGFIGGDVASWGLGTRSAPDPHIDELTARMTI